MALSCSAPAPSSGARLISTDGRILPLRTVDLAVDACAGLARIRLRHRFVNPSADPLHVTWQVPLPVDSAVSGYAFELGDRRVDGVIDRREAARERFEQALVEGRTAALLEEDRSSLFTQEVGNVPPHSEVVCELILDQRLSWLPTGAWQWRFPTTVAPRFLGHADRVTDADRVTVDVADRDPGARLGLSLDVRDVCTGPVHSPSHALSADAGTCRLADPEGAALDRDVVVEWPVAAAVPGTILDVARASADRSVTAWTHGLLTVVPPSQPTASVRRDLIVLLDTSGSMGGAPLAQAKAVTRALLESLGDDDTIELIEFSNRPRRWKRRPVSATSRHRRAAIAWVEGLRAGGGTQMKDGILAALASIRDEAQRQIVLITDGLIGFEAEIIGAIAGRLPRGSRVHTLGIGSSVNRTLTAGAARAGGGIEAIVGTDEAPDEAARRLVAHTAAPIVVDLELSGDGLVACPLHRTPDLMAGAPSLIPLRLRPEGGQVVVHGHTASGSWQRVIDVPAIAAGEGSPAVLTLYGRAAVDAAELAETHTGERADETIERLGLDYRIATRRTSWIAVSQARTVDPNAPSRRETVPQALPHGTSPLGFGLRRAKAMPHAAPQPAALMASMPTARALRAPIPAPKRKRLFSRGAAEQPVGSSAPRDEGGFDADIDMMAAPEPLTDQAPPRFERATGAPLPGGRPERPDAPLVLRGRLLRLSDGRVALEVLVDRELRWAEVDDAVAVLDDGREIELLARPGDSTRPCDAVPGQVLRVVFDDRSTAGAALPDDLGRVRIVTLQMAGGSVTVAV